MFELLTYTAEFILIWMALGSIKLWYFRYKRKQNKNYPFGIETGDEQ